MKKIIKFTTALIVLISVSAFTNKTSSGGTGYKLGDVATDFRLENINGEMVSLSNFDEAKGFIVVFTCWHISCIVTCRNLKEIKK